MISYILVGRGKRGLLSVKQSEDGGGQLIISSNYEVGVGGLVHCCPIR